ncbi:MAG: hypothetical protein ACRDRK_14690 [Pseudonocardia sp.]
MGPLAVTQALVAVGGRARRLREDGVHVGPSKAFIVSGRRSLLYWCLTSLQWAGITDVVLAGNQQAHLERAMQVAEHVVGFNSVTTFLDAGLGVHGIPHQAIDLLQPQFVFEAGHGVSAPGHYREMIRAKLHDAIVFSAFAPDPVNPRYLTSLDRDGSCDAGSTHALAHPMVIDMDYADALPHFGFDVNRLADHYREQGRLRAVVSELPPEFDVAAEFHPSLRLYRENRATFDGFPWRAPSLIRRTGPATDAALTGA